MQWARYVTLALTLAVVGACGGGDDDLGLDDFDLDDLTADLGTTDFDLGTTGAELAIDLPGFGTTEFEPTPGRIRFLSVIGTAGQPTPVDIYWGGPGSIADTEPVATIEYGVASEYMTPMRPVSPLFPDADISFTATAAGTDEVLITWDRFVPDDFDRLVVMYRDESDGGVWMSDFDEAQPNFTEFPEPPSGQVTINYRVLGDMPSGPSGHFVGLQGDGRCLALGSNILDESGYQLAGDVASTFVSAGAELALHNTEILIDDGEPQPHVECTGEPLSNSVTTPAGGRAMVIAVTDPATGGPGLVLVPIGP